LPEEWFGAVTTIIQAEQLTMRFGPFTVLSELDLEVRAGEVHAIIGPNGAGKTTLLHVLAGDLLPSAGRIRFDGKDITFVPMYRRARLGLGRSYQIARLFPGVTCQQALQLALQRDSPARDWLSRGRCRLLAERALSMLETAGMAQCAHQETTSLSHGLQKQLEIVLALANEPRLLLLDEPMAGMSASERIELGARIRLLAARQTIVLVDHDIEMVMSIADRISVMHNGRIVVEGSPSEVRASRIAQAIYLGAANA
jgi:branched-chain amino acid transport system ATP-binding protein